MSYFTEEQVSLLLKPIHPHRVLQRDGMSYVEGYDIRAELNRVFGFGRWDAEILDQALICEEQVTTKAYTNQKTGETKGGRPAWYVVYRSRVRLIVKAPDGTRLAHYDGTHVGESTHPVRGEAHGNAVTNSETYALRRCAINLGDQFGLSLYNKGSIAPLVRWTLVRPAGDAPADTDDVPQVTAESDGSAAHAETDLAAENTAAPAGHGRQSAADAFENAAPVRPAAPAVVTVTRDEAWLDGALAKAPGLPDIKACQALWRDSSAKVRAGELAKDEASRLQKILAARMADLRAAALDSEDPWATKIDSLASPEEAGGALAEVAGLLSAGHIDRARADQVSAAILARFPQAANETRAAA